MAMISTIDISSADAGFQTSASATETPELLEQGAVLFFPGFSFEIDPSEKALLSPTILASAKNVSFDPASGRVGGTSLSSPNVDRIKTLMARFSDRAAALVNAVLPLYRHQIQRARASFRPMEIAGRSISWRKDDARMHIDSFPATPVQGRRILRVFSNVNPVGRARTWRVGEDFELVAHRFAPALRLPWPGTVMALSLLHLTKTRRSPYDSLMLQIHDRMKRDDDFQQHSSQQRFDFPAGSTWMAFTDQVPHAAISGQYQLEQTFLLPVAAMIDESRSPLRVLEQLKQRRLA